MTVEERIAQTVAELQRHGWTEREIEELIDRMVEQGRFELTAADEAPNTIDGYEEARPRMGDSGDEDDRYLDDVPF